MSHFVSNVGSRVCLGRLYSKNLLFLVLSHLLQNFRLELPPGEEGKTAMDLLGQQMTDIPEVNIFLCAQPLA